MGGISVAIEKAFIQQEIQNSAYQEQKEIEEGKKKVIGVNTFCTEERWKIDTFKYDKDSEIRIIKDLNKLKNMRDEKSVQNVVRELKIVAQSSENIIPVIIKAVKVYATIQEICDALREVFGEYESPQIF
jgi:methylmalonyl-CoA mutase N-terminal domain/subunit